MSEELKQSQFMSELKTLLNKYSKENDSDTSGWILAEYLNDCLVSFSRIIRIRDQWWNFKPWENTRTSGGRDE